MRGESDRECRARGGRAVSYNAKGSVPLKIFKGNTHSPNSPDASLKRGGGPLFRKRGGRLPAAFKEHEGDPEERDEKATGGAISGGSSKPSMGRAGRRAGGACGKADMKPTTYPETPSMPKGTKLMGESEKVP